MRPPPPPPSRRFPQLSSPPNPPPPLLPSTRGFRVVLDEHVKPSETVIDYLSHVSGLSVELLNNAKLDGTATCRRLLDETVSPDDVIVGHSLWSDFESLEWWTHSRFIDTSLLFSVKDAPRLTLGLKDLVEVVLGADASREFFYMHV